MIIPNYYTCIPGAMMDFEDFYRRVARQLPDPCRIVEVGVADGRSAFFLANELLKLNKKFKIFLVDSMDYGGREQIATLVSHIVSSGFGINIELMPYDSLSASCKFNDNSLDFVFIDASHKYEETKADIRLWYRKVKDEGILAGHDFYLYEDEVGKAVREVIPLTVKRTDIPDREFDPEQVRFAEQTDKSCGVWWLRKQFYIKLD